MDGEKIPLVFFPRFSTFTGADIEFYSQPIDMLAFEKISITAYRGIITGSGTLTVEMWADESADLIKWNDLLAPFDPSGAGNVEATQQVFANIAQRYVRMGLKLGGTNPSLTMFAIGWAARTQT